MAYTSALLSGPVQYGNDRKRFFYDSSTLGDSFATVTGSGYFNNTDDNIRMSARDILELKTSAGEYILSVTASTGGAVTLQYVDGDYPVETGSTSAALSGFGLSVLAAAATGTERIYRLPAPVRAGQRKSVITNTATDHSIISTGGYAFGTTGETSITLVGYAGAESKTAIELLAVTTTQYIIIGSHYPSTAFAPSTGNAPALLSST